MQKRVMVKRGFITLALIGIEGVLHLLSRAGTTDKPVIERTTKGDVWPKGDEIPTQLAFKNIPLPEEKNPAYRLPRRGTKSHAVLMAAASKPVFSSKNIVHETGYSVSFVSSIICQFRDKGIVVMMHKGTRRAEGNTYCVPQAVKALL